MLRVRSCQSWKVWNMFVISHQIGTESICSAINSWAFRHLQSTATKGETHVSQPPGIFLGCDDAVRLGRSL